VLQAVGEGVDLTALIQQDDRQFGIQARLELSVDRFADCRIERRTSASQ
jgi:hypothetical protein